MSTVSVVIPTFNRRDLLQRSIDSVLSQTYTDFELLVVDDASTDDTVEVVSNYEDDRVTCVEHERNRGAPAARNTGIARAKGEYVAFLDSDDMWHETKLEKQLRTLSEKGAGDGWVAVYTNSTVENTDWAGRIRSSVASVLSAEDDDQPHEGDESLVGEILAGNVSPNAGSTLLVETHVAREVGGFDEELPRFQDPDFLLRILGKGKVAYVEESLVTRYMTPMPPAQTIELGSKRYLEKHSDTIDALGRDASEIFGTHNLVLAKAFLREGCLRRGLGYLRQSNAEARHVPGLLWAVARGFRFRLQVR